MGVKGMIQQLRNPFLRNFSLGTPLFHCMIFWLTSGWCFKDYVILEQVNNKSNYTFINNLLMDILEFLDAKHLY